MSKNPQGASSDPPPAESTAEDAGRLENASTGRLIAILAMLVLFSEVVPLQFTMVGAIIPKIGHAFPDVGTSVSWSMTITSLVGAASLALVGKFADLAGKKKVLLGISVFFLVGSVLCALTSNWVLFLVGRALQALSLGMPAISYGVVRDLMPRRWVPISVGVIGTGFGLAAVIAPLIGGALTDHYSYKAIFWFLTIYMAVLIPAFFLVVPESPFRAKQRLDWIGAVLFGAGIAGVLIYLSEGESWGWTDPGCLAYVIAGIVVLVAFVLWENRTSHPIMELSLLRSRDVALVMALGVSVTVMLNLPNYVIPYMFQTPTPDELNQQVLGGIAAQQNLPVDVVSQFAHLQGDIGYAAGFSVFEMAWHITLWTALSSMVFGPLGGIVARKVGARIPLFAGTAALLVTFVLWWQWHTTWQEQALIGILWGFGFGMYYAASPNLMMDAVPADRQGISAGMLAAFGGVGSGLATALITPILTNHPLQLVVSPPGGEQVVQDVPQVYTDEAYTQIYLLVGVCAAVVSVVLALLFRGGRTPARGGAPEPGAPDAAAAGSPAATVASPRVTAAEAAAD